LKSGAVAVVAVKTAGRSQCSFGLIFNHEESMAKGGKRSGAGRPKGSPNKNQAVLRDYAQRIACGEGVDTPLDILLEAMRYFHAVAVEHERGNTVFIVGSGDAVKAYSAIELRMLAMEAAVKAAPFVHPKLAAIDATVSSKVSLEDALLELDKSTDDLEAANALEDVHAASYRER
jgi:hypothetical protein